jgi:hypothetical protein
MCYAHIWCFSRSSCRVSGPRSENSISVIYGHMPGFLTHSILVPVRVISSGSFAHNEVVKCNLHTA